MSPEQEPIAIVGVGGVFPGAPDLSTFWSNLENGVDSTREVPAGRWSLDLEHAFDAERGKADRVYARRGGFVEDFTLELRGLQIDPALAERLDPMVHLCLHAGRDAFEAAHTDDLDRARVSVVLGNIALPTESTSRLADWVLSRHFEREVFAAAGVLRPPDVHEPVEPINRYVTALPAGVLARALGLRGPHYTLDAACSSSLFAVGLAVDELREGRADLVLAGGLSRPDCLYTQMGFSQLGALSPTGRCSPFDARGDGLVVGEGAGVVALKRLCDAERDGDHIHALICAVGISNDRDGNLLAPSEEGQLRAMRSAYERASWSPTDVDLIECHATGTPVGDAVEFGSLRAMWGETPWKSGQCVIGSVKSNVGHLLTGAGAAGLLKVLGAFEHETLPPTANFSSPADGIEMSDSPFRVLTRAEPWKRRDADTPRRAAVSGFGFGGTNAHLLLEEYRRAPRRPVRPAVRSEPIAIVGLAVNAGPWQDTEAFERRVLGQGDEPASGGSSFGEPMPAGFRRDRLEVPLGVFRIPPKEIAQSLPQQMWMLQVARDAVRDAGDLAETARTGVFVGIGLDLNTTNYQLRWNVRAQAPRWAEALGVPTAEVSDWTDALCESAGPALNANRTMGALGGIVASRIARELRFGGPSYVVSSEEASGLTALDVAVRQLRNHRIDAALVGAVDLTSELRTSIATDLVHPYSASGTARPFDRRADGTVTGDAAVALVLKRLSDAEAAGDRILAVVRGVGAASGGEAGGGLPEEDAYRASLQRAHDDGSVLPESIGLVEAHGSGDPAQDGIEAAALRDFYDTAVLLGSTKGDVGHCGAAAALVSLAKVVTCLRHSVVPALRGLRRPRDLGTLIAPTAPQYWVHDTETGPRRAIVGAMSSSGAVTHAILEEWPGRDDAQTRPFGPPEEGLFVLQGDDVAALHAGLEDLASRAREARGRGVHSLARDWWKDQPASPAKKLGLGLVARDPGDLERLCRATLDGLRDGADLGERTAGRVFFSPQPLRGEVAFVFPGSGSQFEGMGRDLGASWPAVFRDQERRFGQLRTQVRPDDIWHGGEPDCRALILAQVTLGTLGSDLVRQFGVEPQAVIGYSLGETAGLFALGAWHERDRMLARVEKSELFVTQLAGPCEAARRHWGLPESDDVDWHIGVVDRPADAVRAAVEKEERAYLLIVNTPDECVIGGAKGAVERVVERLGARLHQLDGITTVHCEVAQEVADAYRAIHLQDTRAPQGVRFYSGAWGRSYEVTRERTADSVLAQALEGVDYPKTIRAAYDDGVRIFVECGPGRSCTRMIERILEGRPFAARSVSVAGQHTDAALLRTLAMLVSERVPVDLSPLYDEAPREERVAPEAVVEVEIGRPGFGPIPTLPQPAAVVELPLPVAPGESDAPGPAEGIVRLARSSSSAHAAFLSLATRRKALAARQAKLQLDLVGANDAVIAPVVAAPDPEVFMDRAACLEFAVGSIGKVWGARFAEVDANPTRVRLPDEPLMLVDRILELSGEARSMGAGRVVSEHDVLEGAWYLDGGRIPTCVAVEAGQADLLLSGWLGIDFETRGLATYRLLDATVTFHDELPRPGETIRYEIHIEGFERTGDSWLFRFHYDATVGGRPLMSMRDGCAGFFTPEHLASGQGIIRSKLDQLPVTGLRPADWTELVPMQRESLDDAQVEALRRGDLGAAFGGAFTTLPLDNALPLPSGKMHLVDRVTEIDPQGGRYGLGSIVAEADIHPDDWFLTCHFVDDKVMPGTLMYECCTHTLRIFLMRMGWVGEADRTVWQPVVGTKSRLRCRGQVLETTKKVGYEIHIKELGYGPEPYAIVDAMIYADGKPIVDIGDMTLRLTGTTREEIETLWSRRAPSRPAFTREQILAFSTGNPSDCFGPALAPFDRDRRIARLPRPPYQFLDRIVEVSGAPFEMVAGPSALAQFDVAPDGWYFAANRQEDIPFAVLLEVALQPCGFLAAYVGSALTSDRDLKFRNLGGEATLHARVLPERDVLQTRTTLTEVSVSGGMIIQQYEFEVRSRQSGLVYDGKTSFGFFTPEALGAQIGLTSPQLFDPEVAAAPTAFPEGAPLPTSRWRMVDRVDVYQRDGGPKGLGFIRGSADVNPEAWFFEAHFYQDPVWPGSLGVESFLQLLKVFAMRRFGLGADARFTTGQLGDAHRWSYRGQIIPTRTRVDVEAQVTRVDEASRTVWADGFLTVDGLPIYELHDFALGVLDG